MSFQLSLNTETVASTRPAEPLYVEPDAPVRDVFALLKAQNSGSVLICRDGALIGIFTERDALRLMASEADLSVPIETVMSANPVTVRVEDTVGKAIRGMSQGGYRRLPIVNESGQPTGVVKVSGIVHYLVEHFPDTIYNLPPAPNPITQEREGA